MLNKRLAFLVVIFVILTVVSVIYIYRSFKTLLELPENMPETNRQLSEGFWLNFGMVYYFSPIKMIALTFGFYTASLFLVDYVDKNIRKVKEEKTIIKNSLS